MTVPECFKQYYEDKTSNISCMTPWRMSLTKGVQHKDQSTQPINCTEEELVKAYLLEALCIDQYMADEACPGYGLLQMHL